MAQRLIVVVEILTPELAKEMKKAIEEKVGIPVTVLGGNIKQALVVEVPEVGQIDPLDQTS